MLFQTLRPAIHALDPERAHRLTIAALKAMPGKGRPDYPAGLGVDLAGLHFPTPLGLAPGFDKDAEVPRAMLALGFGHVEVGTLTPRPQAGNPKPRLFRLVEDRAVINRMGFNNGGMEAAHRCLLKRGREQGLVGVNVGANKDTDDRIADYCMGVAAMANVADYITVNISSPNTPGLRNLQAKGELEALLEALAAQRREGQPPVFLKVAPDLEEGDHERIVRAALDNGIAALIVSNTTISRPPLASRQAGEAGGLSGAPLKPLALAQLRRFYAVAKGALPLIGVGGIANAEDAWERIRAGAHLVQLYSALVYEGPGLAKRINRDLAELMQRDGFATIAEAVGSE
ncbi:quinone-dependent dihydroorotate dehydrogenase [Erythrobacter sp. EC-HK427]|uniref:quinone-dependent dihydroorotate dehydrogenase n=1 Tax=Erythrobacter sp. EC-HK427 TaxID=2038396 RepID=UPI0012585051|nr:quinone-dependent dihydroorotate dehydrogenase [Erythrobacter sp. EC-HK427]VVT03071.1 Dihydroorotate dehydrogenase (quinone) [Erythrobacter sp. EC-HK427]